MKVSVVIPTWNGGELFHEVLDRVLDQEADFPFEVICIDSGSTDGTVEFIRSRGVRLIAIEPGTFNHGLTRNQGIREAGGDLVALLVQDATPADGSWLRALVGAFELCEGIAGAWSRQVPRPDCNPFLRDRLEKWMGERSEPEIQEIEGEDAFLGLEPLDRLKRIAFDDVSSMISREVWSKHPYRERNFGEDIDWSKRVLLDRYRIAFEPRSAVVHSHNNSLWYEFRRLYCDHQNLREMVGLTLVSTPFALVRQAVHGVGHYAKILRRARLPFGRKLALGPYMLALPFAENLGQYLGSHSRKWMARHGWFERLDRFLKKRV